MSTQNFKIWLEKEILANDFIDGNNLIFFFVKHGIIYGATENNRLIFANLKKPDAETSKDWADEAIFSAFDLLKAICGNESQYVFRKKDIRSIKVINSEEVKILLNKLTCKNLS